MTGSMQGGAMQGGAMQEWPLLTWRLLEHAAATYPNVEIVTQSVEGPLHRTTWRETSRRARRLAAALVRLGVRPGDRVGTLAWNTHRHIECWYAAPGLGAVVHTLNPRLFAEQLSYIINHADDRVLLFDVTFLPLVEQLAPGLPGIRSLVVLADRAHMPESRLDLLCYEDLLAAEGDGFAWLAQDENAPAALCYTSGTTGHPKGVLYSHRSSVLHTFAIVQPDYFALSSRSVVMPVVPLFHANGWGIPYTAAMVGAKLVMGGPNHDPATIQHLIESEGVTIVAAVPTIWLSVLQHLQASGAGLGALERVVIGGSAAPRAVIETFEQVYGVSVVHCWGLTETSPLGSGGMLSAAAMAGHPESQLNLKCKQGRPPFGIELAITDDDGRSLPWDGVSAGHLKVRGPWVVARYFRGDATALDGDGWFATGDIATVDALSCVQITDRAKDIIKSGGEWISSIELENAALGCPGVAEAAAIGVPHPKWSERPLLVLVRQPGADVAPDVVRAFLAANVAKWWVPEDIVFMDAIPHTATGKIDKKALRQQLAAPRGH